MQNNNNHDNKKTLKEIIIIFSQHIMMKGSKLKEDKNIKDKHINIIKDVKNFF